MKIAVPHCKFFFNDVASGKELCSILGDVYGMLARYEA